MAEVCSVVLDGPIYGRFGPHVRAGGSGKGSRTAGSKLRIRRQLSRLRASLSCPCWSCRLVTFLSLEVSVFVASVAYCYMAVVPVVVA